MNKKVLIIEDEQYLSEMYKMKFESEGYKVVTANNGLVGLEKAQQEMPDVILLDLVMPKMDGYQVLEKLKADEKTKDIKVIVLSNLGQNDEVKKGMKEGASGYLIKASLTPTQVESYVSNMLNSASGKKTVDSSDEKKEEPSNLKEKNGIKVLLIEDEEAIIEMYKLRLTQEGYEVETARNGAWGLKQAKEKEFDIILMDIVMPAMNGYEMLKQLKTDSKNHSVPIIVLSNSAQDRDIEKTLKCGASCYLLKASTTPTKLIKEVEKILKK